MAWEAIQTATLSTRTTSPAFSGLDQHREPREMLSLEVYEPCSNRACCFGCLKGVLKSVQVLLSDIEAVMVLTLIILK